MGEHHRGEIARTVALLSVSRLWTRVGVDTETRGERRISVELRGARNVIGIGRVKTPTLAIACRRELVVRDFVPVAYFEVVATAQARGGAFRMRHAPKERIVERAKAQAALRRDTRDAKSVGLSRACEVPGVRNQPVLTRRQ